MKEIFITLLTVDSANSRLVYLCQGLVTALVTLGIGVAYLLVHDSTSREGFSNVLLILLGGGSLGSIARGVSKKVGG